MRNVLSAISMAALVLLSACALTPQELEMPAAPPVFPPPPEAARFIYERSLFSSADVVAEDETNRFRRWVTGERRAGEGFAKPYGLAVHQGRVFVSDTGRGTVMVFDIPGGRFFQIGAADPGTLAMPLGLDVDRLGRVYVCDAPSKRVMIYDRDGKFLRAIGGGDWFVRPAGIAVDPDGARVYVVDIGNVKGEGHRVRVFDAANGRHLFDIGKRGTGTGEFNLPRDAALGPDGRLYVVDGGNFRVQVFDRKGKFLHSFGGIGRQGGQFSRPKEIAVDAAGNVYVADAAFGNFQVFAPEGKLLLAVGRRGARSAPAAYMLPSGIAVDGDGRVYMVDQFHRRVDVFRPASLAPADGFLAVSATPVKNNATAK